jgi:hypothetical protein
VIARPRWSLLVPVLLVLSLTVLGSAQEYRVETLDESAPAELAPEILAQLKASGVRVMRGESRTVCDIWWCKAWPVDSAEAEGDLIYPFTTGQLLGAIRFARRMSDFRDQQIDGGVYTLRYGKQPVDGDHVGTSPTRDFALLVPAAEDKSLAAPDYEALVERSNLASGTTHPALLSLQRAEGDGPLREISDREWWLVRLAGEIRHGEQTEPLAVDMVVVGQAE